MVQFLNYHIIIRICGFFPLWKNLGRFTVDDAPALRGVVMSLSDLFFFDWVILLATISSFSCFIVLGFAEYCNGSLPVHACKYGDGSHAWT